MANIALASAQTAPASVLPLSENSIVASSVTPTPNTTVSRIAEGGNGDNASGGPFFHDKPTEHESDKISFLWQANGTVNDTNRKKAVQVNRVQNYRLHPEKKEPCDFWVQAKSRALSIPSATVKDNVTGTTVIAIKNTNTPLKRTNAVQLLTVGPLR